MSKNPFEALENTPPDEAEELGKLARSIQLADSFSLLFAQCNQHSHRKRLVAEFKARFPEISNIQEVELKEPIRHLLHELQWIGIDDPPPDALFVSGLEYSLPNAETAHATLMVANLNIARDVFGKYIHCPMVLWVPEYARLAISRGAPDFFSVRSGVYYFATTPEETAAFTESMTMDNDEWLVDNLLLSERQERIVAIESLLDDYRALSPSQRDCRAEGRLLTKLGNLYRTLGQLAKAAKYYQQSLAICQELGDLVGEGQTLYYIGALYHQRGHWAEAESVFRDSLAIRRKIGDRGKEAWTLNYLGWLHSRQEQWEEAEVEFQNSLKICREVGDRVCEGQILYNLGWLYGRQGFWAEAETACQQSLAICREVSDYVGEGKALNNLGDVYLQQGRWTEAEEALRQSLKKKLELGEHRGKGWTLKNLANLYQNQGRWKEAEEYYEQSLSIWRDFGDRVSEGKVLKDFARLRATQDDIKGALKFGRQAITVLETTEDKAALEEVQRLVVELERQVNGKE